MPDMLHQPVAEPRRGNLSLVDDKLKHIGHHSWLE
jgi:hypothetical protein